MKNNKHCGLLLILCFVSITSGIAQVLVKRQVTLMGSVFEISLVDRDSSITNQHIDEVISEIDRIENLISEWRPQTQIAAVNRNAGIKPVKVDREVFELTQRAIQYAQNSGGAFDISIVALDKVWLFDGSMTTMPSEEVIKRSVEKVGYQHIRLDSAASTIFLELPGMKIGFGSIGKGYAADRGREIMKAKGIEAGIVNASGDLSAWGSPPQDDAWKVGVNNPFKAHRMVKVLRLNEMAVATSGSYEKYAEINGKRYSHIINPVTGYPATGLTSVTIYGPSAEVANALSTSIMVLGEKEGKKLIQRFPAYHYIFITDKDKVIQQRQKS
ncbi:FAD:protein FMN transferase [Sphingobacterium siyangense]|uniref:FAD:protein FMN transferase n=1 Tax=Sphingobacterium TaxID=28453 RepID=UPI000E054D53|nr:MULTISPECIES: FAD:protein FMN transferase [Sphingobacterium]QQT46733.1 FAD:protein FMN transferase [Sphingobacterium multivorum]SUJ89127.1 Thiamine biosynthesis lipoprotein ApbE precursor [Sphingobacterium multivorum]